MTTGLRIDQFRGLEARTVHRAHVTRATAQAVAASTPTDVQFTAEVYDHGGLADLECSVRGPRKVNKYRGGDGRVREYEFVVPALLPQGDMMNEKLRDVLFKAFWTAVAAVLGYLGTVQIDVGAEWTPLVTTLLTGVLVFARQWVDQKVKADPTL